MPAQSLVSPEGHDGVDGGVTVGLVVPEFDEDGRDAAMAGKQSK